MEKRTLRRESFRRIKGLPDSERVSFSEKIVSFLSSLPEFETAESVFSYAAMSSEPDLDALRERFPEKRWGLSRVDDEGAALHFHEVVSGENLQRSSFGFLEPNPESCPVITGPDLILVPGVGFDPETKARLGRGQGHYDRYLAPLIESESPPFLVGVSFATQWFSLVAESHDIPMHALVSEEGVV